MIFNYDSLHFNVTDLSLCSKCSYIYIYDNDLIRPVCPGFDSQQGKNILFFTASRPTLGPTQPPIQWISGAISPDAKRPGREADQSHPSSAEVKNGGAIPPLPHMSSWHNA
jgi:hypothetical protein